MADPGFPRGGGANPRGHQHMILQNFPKYCMKLKEFGPPRRGRASLAPLRSATVKYCINTSSPHSQKDGMKKISSYFIRWFGSQSRSNCLALDSLKGNCSCVTVLFTLCVCTPCDTHFCIHIAN